MSNFPSTEPQPEESRDLTDHITSVPRAAQARLLLHNLEADPSFRMNAIVADAPLTHFRRTLAQRIDAERKGPAAVAA